MESVTLSTLLFIVAVFIPGHFFKRFYFSGKFTKQFTAGDFAERLVTSLFWGVLIQLFTFYLFSVFVEIDVHTAGDTVTSVVKMLGENNFSTIGDIEFGLFFSYLFVSLGISVISGFLFHHLVRILKLDVRIGALRFTNEWHYLFSGQNLKPGNRRMGKGRIEAVALDIIAQIKDDETRLYSGLLNHYSLNSSGELETITITGTERWSKRLPGFVPISGDCFTIPYNKVININQRYIVKQRTPNSFSGRFAIVKNVSLALFVFSLLSSPFFISINFYGKISVWLIIVGIIVTLIWLTLFGATVTLLFDSTKLTKERITIGVVMAFILFILGWTVKVILL